MSVEMKRKIVFFTIVFRNRSNSDWSFRKSLPGNASCSSNAKAFIATFHYDPRILRTWRIDCSTFLSVARRTWWIYSWTKLVAASRRSFNSDKLSTNLQRSTSQSSKWVWIFFRHFICLLSFERLVSNEYLIVRSFPISALIREKKLSGQFRLENSNICLHNGIQLRSATFQVCHRSSFQIRTRTKKKQIFDFF